MLTVHVGFYQFKLSLKHYINSFAVRISIYFSFNHSLITHSFHEHKAVQSALDTSVKIIFQVHAAETTQAKEER